MFQKVHDAITYQKDFKSLQQNVGGLSIWLYRSRWLGKHQKWGL